MQKYLKELLIACCLALALPDIADRFADVGGLAAQGAYLALAGILWGTLIAAAYVPYAWLRWTFAITLAISAYYFSVYERATAQFMTYDAFINMLNSAAFADDALAQNRSAFIAALVPAVLLLLAIGIRPRRKPPVPALLLASAPLLGVALLTGILFLRGGDGARGLPSSLPP
ncbi:MAG: sulfatase, partial [Proteobacteria bacterium]